MRPLGHRKRVLSFVTLRWFLAVVGFFLMNGPMNEALAAVPGEINFQGLLLDSGGLVVDGPVDLDFELFDAASAGTSLWSEAQPGVAVLNGVYNVALGSITPIGVAVLAGGSVWLEITVEGETLSPRQPLLAVAYALRSAEADFATSADTATSADFATSADTATSVDFATTVDTIGNLPSGWLEAVYSMFPLDGALPPNDDPSEGLADTDGDGVLNFVDPDNDNDGLSDAIELGQGTDINLVTPTIIGTVPSIASDANATAVTVTGTGFIVGQTVTVGSQTPTPTNITPTSFDLVVNAEPPTSTTLVVTRPNGQQASLPFSFGLTVPEIDSLTPISLLPGANGTVEVVGTDFLGAFTVTLDGSPITPTNVTATSFSIFVNAPGVDSSLPVVVTLSNGESASKVLYVGVAKTVFTTSSVFIADAIGGLAGGDAICAAHATAAGLPGTFLAWLGDSTGSPATRFTQSTALYVRTDGVFVAADYADLTGGTVKMSPNADEFGLPIPYSMRMYVWTGTNSDGTANSDHCQDWTATTGSGRRGILNSGSVWPSYNTGGCFLTHNIYCFEQ